MKRGLLISGVLVAALAITSGTVFAFSHAKAAKEEPAAPAPSQYTGIDKTVEVASVDIEGKAVRTIGSTPCFATLFAGPGRLLSESDAAVHARVENVEYFVLSGLPWNKMDVIVLDSFKGDVQAGDRISICQFGGYVPLAEQIRYFHDESRFSDMSADEINTTVMKSTMDGAPLPQVGEEGVYFLVTDRTPNLPLGAYEVTSSYQGKYILNDDGILKRFAPTDGYYLTDEQRQSKTIPPDALANGERPYTLEQMKAVVHS